MNRAAVIIPNMNGRKFLEACLTSLRQQSVQDFITVMIDNGSTDGSVEYVREQFPEVRIRAFHSNTGFCHAVNAGIAMTEEPYVILLNNDTVCEPGFVEELLLAMETDPRIFSCGAKMVSMKDPSVLDDAGDFYTAAGWAFARGKDQPVSVFNKKGPVFAACGGAAVYRREILEEIGLLDEHHFAYLEDIDLGYRARIHGYRNIYVPSAVVQHYGSGSSGSRYNSFKVKHASRNSVYVVYKNMPLWQLLLNSPLLLAGFAAKAVYFSRMGFGRDYLSGLYAGIRGLRSLQKVKTERAYLSNYVRIQLELWANLLHMFIWRMKGRQ